MIEYRIYRVLGRRDYRGHVPGTEFPAMLDSKAERRAIMRGSIELIGTRIPKPENFTFPRGWLEPLESPAHRDADEASLSLKEE